MWGDCSEPGKVLNSYGCRKVGIASLDFQLKDDFIKLGQLLKACGFVGNGAEAKEVITEGQVLVNGEICLQRGKKCCDGDVVEWLYSRDIGKDIVSSYPDLAGGGAS